MWKEKTYDWNGTLFLTRKAPITDNKDYVVSIMEGVLSIEYYYAQIILYKHCKNKITFSSVQILQERMLKKNWMTNNSKNVDFVGVIVNC